MRPSPSLGFRTEHMQIMICPKSKGNPENGCEVHLDAACKVLRWNHDALSGEDKESLPLLPYWTSVRDVCRSFAAR